MNSKYRKFEPANRALASSVRSLNWNLSRLTGYVEVALARALVFICYGIAFSMLPAFALAAVVKSSGYVVRRNPKTYRDHPLDDGTARYDDVWGG